MRSIGPGCDQGAAFAGLPRVSGVGAPGKRGESPKAAPPHASPVLRPRYDPLPRSERCRVGARQAAHTRRQCRERWNAEAHHRLTAESPTQAHVARRSRPRAHSEALMVAVRPSHACCRVPRCSLATSPGRANGTETEVTPGRGETSVSLLTSLRLRVPRPALCCAGTPRLPREPPGRGMRVGPSRPLCRQKARGP